MYDKATARWMSKDPIEFEGGTNLYEYVLSMPTYYFDPSGEQRTAPIRPGTGGGRGGRYRPGDPGDPYPHLPPSPYYPAHRPWPPSYGPFDVEAPPGWNKYDYWVYRRQWWHQHIPDRRECDTTGTQKSFRESLIQSMSEQFGPPKQEYHCERIGTGGHEGKKARCTYNCVGPNGVTTQYEYETSWPWGEPNPCPQEATFWL
jgi:hypothetical protein